MNVTTQLECGNGRILRAGPELIEVELIAYSKGSRYTFFRITDIDRQRKQSVVLRPDSRFRMRTFPYKQFAEVWVRYDEGEWQVVADVVKEPEEIRFTLDLRPGQVCDVSTEPPRRYTETTRELIALAREKPEIATLYSPGASEEGRPIVLLRVTAPDNRTAPGEEARPVVHIACGEHATEFSGEEIGRGMLAEVLSPRGADLRQRFIFDFVLNCNPDGNFHGWHQYNARDWQEHNYEDKVDRSWHHEFAPYMTSEPGVYSQETAALMEWVRTTRPGLYVSLHSWEGHEGNPGSFYTDEKLLAPDLAAAMNALNEVAQEAAREDGYRFDAVPTSNLAPSPHLGHLLMEREIALAYLPEGNYAIGKAALQTLGRRLVRRWLDHPAINLDAYDPTRWERLNAPKEREALC